jgi:PAS domain S-box-containing protein
MKPATPQPQSAAMPRGTLGAYLVVVMLVATVPLALMLAYQLFNDLQQQHRRLNQDLERGSIALASSIERELYSTVDALTILSHALRTQDDRLPALRRALQGQPQRPGWRSIYLRGPDGRILVNAQAVATELPLEPMQPVAGDPSPAGAAAISNLIGSADRLGTAIEIPFIAEDGKRYMLGVWIDVAHWQRLVASGGVPEGGYLSIFDRERRLIARSDSPQSTGQLLPAAAIQLMAGRYAGTHRIEQPGGVAVYSAWQLLPISGWGVGVGVPAAPLDVSQRQAILAALATTAACLILGVALATLLARRITDPLSQLATGDPAQPVAPVVREIAQLRQALDLARESQTHARADLQRKADEFQALFASTPIGLAFTSDGSPQAVLHNAAMDALVGPAVSGSAAHMVLNGRTLQAHEHPLRQAADSGEAVGPLELELQLDDGTTRHVLARAVPLFDAQQRVLGAAAAMVDITERKQAEQRVLDADARLRDSQRLVDLAQEAGDVGFFRYRFDDHSVIWTPGAALLLGVAHSDRPPAPDELWAHVHAADRDAVQRRLRSMVDQRRERETIEFRVGLADDTLRWLSCRIMLAFNEDGQPQELVGLTLDISEHKRAERERALLVAGEQAARVEAEAASRAKDEFLAMLGHELRNPLGAIASAVEVLNRVDASTELAVNARLIIARQTRHLAHLMDDLLDVGRVISGKVLLARRRLDLATLVQRVVGNFEVTGATSQHELVLQLDHAWVEVDATRMEQVVSNLLGNAFKYTPTDRRIEVSLRQHEGRALLEVRDHGDGIAPELLPHVFDLFVQGERPLDRRAGGLGIGLTLVRRLVECRAATSASRLFGRHHVHGVDPSGGPAHRGRIEPGMDPTICAPSAGGRGQRRCTGGFACHAGARWPRGDNRRRRRKRARAAAARKARCGHRRHRLARVERL